MTRYDEGMHEAARLAGLRAPSLEGARHPTESRVDMFATQLQETGRATVFPGDEAAVIAALAAIGAQSFTVEVEGARHPEAGETVDARVFRRRLEWAADILEAAGKGDDATADEVIDALRRLGPTETELEAELAAALDAPEESCLVCGQVRERKVWDAASGVYACVVCVAAVEAGETPDD
jgi:hypothetical protein